MCDKHLGVVKLLGGSPVYIANLTQILSSVVLLNGDLALKLSEPRVNQN